MQDVCFEKQRDDAEHAGGFKLKNQAHLDALLEISPVGWFRKGILQINRLSESHLGFLLWRYGTALLLVAIALAATLLVQQFFPYPFLFLFFAAVMASAWFSGTGAGLFAVVISTIVVGYCFVPPFYSFAINATDSTYFAAFIICSFVASWVSSSKKKSEEALKDARDQLELRVALRTGELQKSIAELRESERQLRLLTEVIPQQIWSGTPDGSIDYCNQRLLDYAGCAMQDIEAERFFDILHPEDREGFRQSWQTALATGNLFEGEWRVRGAGGQYRSFFTRGVPLRRAGGKVLRWYGTNTDIEDHKKAEQALMRTQTELTHLSRVLTMGELTSSIAHEVNQPLTAVVTYGHACLEFLSADAPNVQEARQAAERIIQDGTRAGAILGRIRTLFKKEDPSREPFDMNEVIQELLVFLKGEALRDRIFIRTELASDLPKVTGDRIQLQQVMLNLAMNSMDAMRAVNGKRKELLIKSRKESAGQIRVAVEDCGVGLNADMGEKIFNPFFTTKAQGIGMGLSISRSIVESHAGRLWACPRPSGGAIFQFTVPINS
jgi:PAS domain S-box-containing protein